jgi:hypothetical protein
MDRIENEVKILKDHVFEFYLRSIDIDIDHYGTKLKKINVG